MVVHPGVGEREKTDPHHVSNDCCDDQEQQINPHRK
jgi:hypothetical protein